MPNGRIWLIEKGNNTFSRRHHLRIFRRPGAFEGRPIWVRSATDDIDIRYSDRDYTFIHIIDPDIDKERSKVVNDLIFTGMVRSLALVDRYDIPQNATNATGDPLHADGRMAVLLLQQACYSKGKMSQAIDTYVHDNEARFLDELKDLIRIPSISTLPENKEATHRAAEYVADHLKAAGLENVEVIETDRHPLVYADWMHQPGKPTVLCYGHFDVQPPDPLELWESPPFEPTERNGNLYARGSADDKGQMFSHIKAIEALKAIYGKLPVNVKFLVEGEEEVGGISVADYVAKNPEKLKADVALVSDTEMYAPGLPTLNIGLRGLVYMEIEAKGPMRDLHSGLYGGAAPNAVFGLIELLSKAKDADGHILIPGIYDAVEPPSAEEKESWTHLPFDEKEYLETEVGSTALTGEKQYSVFERTWARPTLEVHGIAGGFTGAGAKTVIPAKAVAKVSIRLVPKQDPAAIVKAVEKFVKDNSPPGIQCEVRVLSSGPGLMVNPDHPAIRVAAKAFSDIFGQPTVFTRSGGSIPIVGDFATHLGIPTILMGFGLPDDGLHSPNEKYNIRNYYDGIRTLGHFFEEYGQVS